MVYAIDANILVYAYNIDSDVNTKAVSFMEKEVLSGNLRACLPYQSLYEFYAVITDGKRVENPLSPHMAIAVMDTYLRARNVPKIYPKRSNAGHVFDLIQRYNLSAQEIFDAVLVATLMDNDIDGIITRDVAHFKRFEFLTVLNPLD